MVVVALRVEAAGEAGQTLELGGFTDYDGFLPSEQPAQQPAASAEVGGYTVELVAVMPYPARNDAPPAAVDYQVELLVSGLLPIVQD